MKTKKHFPALFLAVFSVLTPVVAFGAQVKDLKDLIKTLTDLVSLTIPLVAALALLAFFWGLAKFILNADDEESRKSGKQFMIWGIIALFVMVSVWGLVQVIAQTFGIGTGGSINPPQVPAGSQNTPQPSIDFFDI